MAEPAPSSGTISRVDAFLGKIADPRVLQLLILPTEHCNFRCTYCYEEFKIGRMRPETVNAIKLWIDSRVSALNLLEITWFGGEPTLALPTVYELTLYARDAVRAFGPAGARFTSSMTSNAYRLTPDVFERLVGAGVTSYQITLDGPQAVHDRRRLRADGHGTFDVIWANLRGIAERAAALPPGVQINLRVHYDAASVEAIEPLVHKLRDELMPSGLFRVAFHGLERLGGPGDGNIALPTRHSHEVVRRLARMLDEGADGGMSNVTADQSGYVCYAAKANAFVVRADGRIGKCTVALNDPKNDVGRLNPNGTISWIEGRMKPWLRGLDDGDPRVLACPLDGLAAHFEKELARAGAGVAA